MRPQLLPGLISDAQAQQRFVRDHPDDYPVQLAGPPAAPASPYPAETQYAGQLRYARGLVPRFPDSPSLRANLLRYATQTVRLSRPDSSGNLLSGKPDPAPDPKRDGPPPTPALLAAFDADAAAGERLDPDNAYFPFMRAVGLFAANRDAEGLAAVTRAGTRTAWREYGEDEVVGRWRVLDGVYERREAVRSMGVAAALLFPHYQVLRGAARLVTVKAVQEEQAGHRERGLALRRSVARCGDLMRAKGTSLITNFVGISITMISRLRPGGAAAIPLTSAAVSSPAGGSRLEQERLDLYCEYVTRLGRPDAAQEARAQDEDGARVRRLPFGTFLYSSRFQDFWRLTVSLVAGGVLVTLLAFLLLLGLAAWGLGRLPRLRERRPLPAGASFGAWAALVLSGSALFFFHDTPPEDAWGVVFTVGVLLFVPLSLLSLYAVRRPLFRRPFGQAVLAGLVTLAALGVLGALAAWGARGATDTLAAGQQIQELSGEEDDIGSGAFAVRMLWIFATLACLTVFPFLLAVALGIAARVKRVPVSSGLVGGFRLWVPPLVCLLAALYGGLTLWTVRQEDAVNYGLTRSLHGEGQYLAELSGEPWPGPVR